MKKFSQKELKEAIDYAVAGGQALHVHRVLGSNPHPLFAREVLNGRDIAHLFDQNLQRLNQTVRKLGVRVVLVERKGQPSQHVDLCGKPLVRALAMCDRAVQGVLFETGGGKGIYDEDEDA